MIETAGHAALRLAAALSFRKKTGDGSETLTQVVNYMLMIERVRHSMPDQPRRPSYQDYQSPSLYRAGVSLRRSYLTGAADSVEEGMMKALLARFDERTSAVTEFLPRP